MPSMENRTSTLEQGLLQESYCSRNTMKNDKQLLCDAECRKSVGNERGKVEKVALIFAMTIMLLTLFVAFCAWQNTETQLLLTLKDKEMTNPPFNPPSFLDHAKTARYIAHYMAWAVVSSISSQDKEIASGTPTSVSDGPVNNSTGVPYMYISNLNPLIDDLKQNPKASITFSEAQSDYCTRNNYDPEDPRCARLVIYGKVVKVPPEEIPFAKQALFTRHPEMKFWPADHHFFFYKLNINRVNLLDFFGPNYDVPLPEYFAANTT